MTSESMKSLASQTSEELANFFAGINDEAKKYKYIILYPCGLKGLREEWPAEVALSGARVLTIKEYFEVMRGVSRAARSVVIGGASRLSGPEEAMKTLSELLEQTLRACRR